MKKNIIFYSHNFGGLGHTNRLLGIINELIKNFNNYYNIIFLNSGEKQDFLFNKFKLVKVINLPIYNIKNYKIINGNNILLYRKVLYNKILSIGNIEKLIVEHYPFGRNFLNKEIRYLIEIFKKYNKKGKVFSSIRDIIEFSSLNKYNLKLFDRILIHTDKRLFNYNNLFEEEVKNKVVYTGYIVSKDIYSKVKNKKYIVITLGGGQDGYKYIKKILFFIRQLNYKGYIYISLGNNFSIQRNKQLKNQFGERIIVKKYFDNFISLKLNADLVFSMGGYNNLIENLYFKIRTIVFPRLTNSEQFIRLKKFSQNSNYIINGLSLTIDDIKNLIEIKKKRNNNINYNGAYLSANYLFNFNKYKYIKIRLSNVCNAKCSMCGVIKRKKYNNNIKKIKNSIIDFYKLGGEVVNFTGGEPTIYKGFWDLLRLVKSLGLISSVSTNGSTLGKDFLKKIFYNNIKLIDYMDLSIDGLFEKQDIRRKYKGLFNIIINNLNLLINVNIIVHLNITITKDNIGEILDIFKFINKFKLNSISFGIIDSGPNNDTSNLIPNKDSLKKFYLYDRIYILKNSLNKKITFSPDVEKFNFEKFYRYIRNVNAFPKPIGEKCNFIYSKKEIRINEDGSIVPCCILDGREEGLGNINKEKLLYIITSKRYEEFINKRFPNISKSCLNCKLYI